VAAKTFDAEKINAAISEEPLWNSGHKQSNNLCHLERSRKILSFKAGATERFFDFAQNDRNPKYPKQFLRTRDVPGVLPTWRASIRRETSSRRGNVCGHFSYETKISERHLRSDLHGDKRVERREPSGDK
jgi:hypothetical protein